MALVSLAASGARLEHADRHHALGVDGARVVVAEGAVQRIDHLLRVGWLTAAGAVATVNIGMVWASIGKANHAARGAGSLRNCWISPRSLTS